MKNILTLLILSFTSAFVIAQSEMIKNEVIQQVTDEQKEGGPIMQFESMDVDFGTIEQNGEPLRVLKFSNVGDEPLVITNCKGSCGCTVPVWPKEPIMPGEDGVIEIRYATNRLGKINKTVKVTTNEGDIPHTIRVIGEVLTPQTDESIPAPQPSMLNDGQ
jgi:hypothetical protein